MTDLSTDESIRGAFAQLRSDERWVAPPGTDAARRTVRRRRKVAVATASAGITAVVVLGAGYLAGLGAGAPHPGHDPLLDPAADGRTEDPAATGSAGDEASISELRRLAELAMAALDPPDPGGFSTIIAPGFGTPGVTAPPERDPGAEGDPSSTGPQVAGRLVMEDRGPGEYLLQVSCAGSGGVAVTIRAGDNEATATAQCATAAGQVTAGIGEAVLTTGAGGAIEVMAEPDQIARTEAAFVITITRTGP